MAHNRQMGEREDAVAAWVRSFAVETLASEETERVIRLLNEQIADQVPVIARDPELRAALDASTRAQLRSFVTHLVSHGELRPPEEAFVLARELAARGVEMAALLEVYRSGQQAALAYVTAVAGEAELTPELVSGALITVWGSAIEWFAHSVEQLIGAYGEERERWLRSALTRRTQLVAAILAGDRVDIDHAGAGPRALAAPPADRAGAVGGRAAARRRRGRPAGGGGGPARGAVRRGPASRRTVRAR